MIILGINAYHGDVSAALLRDGELVAAVEEERFRRVKHWAGFPREGDQRVSGDGRDPWPAGRLLRDLTKPARPCPPQGPVCGAESPGDPAWSRIG